MDVVEAGQTAGAAVEAQGAELRGQLAEARRVAEDARESVDTMRAEIETVREQSKSVREDAAAARTAAESGERRVEAMQAELTYAQKTLEEVKAGLTSAGQAAVIARREAEQAKRAAQTAGDGNSGVHEVFQQLLAAARGGGPLAGDAGSSAARARRRQDLRRKTQASLREARHGFDDVAQPLAILGLDGRFRELNPAFARLVGYQEQRVCEGRLAVAARPCRVHAVAGATAPACVRGDRFGGRSEHVYARPGPDGPRRRHPQGGPG